MSDIEETLKSISEKRLKFNTLKKCWRERIYNTKDKFLTQEQRWDRKSYVMIPVDSNELELFIAVTSCMLTDLYRVFEHLSNTAEETSKCLHINYEDESSLVYDRRKLLQKWEELKEELENE